MKLIYLDIDGVLNSLQSSWLITRTQVDILNYVTNQTNAHLVLSSSWRYIVHSRNMTIRGFEILLRSHGVQANLNGVTVTDEEIETRELQILDSVTRLKPETWVAVDDCQLMGLDGHFVQTDSNFGLMMPDAEKMIKCLNL